MTPSERQVFELVRKVLWRYRQDTPLGHQPHMIAHEADSVLTAMSELLGPLNEGRKPHCFADFGTNHATDRKCQWCTVQTECKTGEPQQSELDRLVEWAEDLCGVGHKAWDTIDPRLIANAILEAARNLNTTPPQRQPEQEPKCNPHPKAPHGFNRNASHENDRYTCECEGWDAYDAGYQAGVMAGIETAMGEEQKQEPVAWMRKDETCTDCFVWEKTEDHTIPLYTSPPQRQPLTDEQIAEIAAQGHQRWLEFARAIEAAHGIKGEV